MKTENLVDKYIRNTKKAFQGLKHSFNETEDKGILDYARRYLEDAEYYRSQKKFETALVSIVYCEGLLDALRLLGIVEFQWPEEAQKKQIDR
ncbi:MAG: DUF357 domain-containing protein [Candidatus Bathyarchaeota archaeon]|jgi:FAD synthetase|nr:MAG: DUF357 domain-containing protein [Candidatus Bathyarchaeota archaeon]